MITEVQCLNENDIITENIFIQDESIKNVEYLIRNKLQLSTDIKLEIYNNNNGYLAIYKKKKDEQIGYIRMILRWCGCSR